MIAIEIIGIFDPVAAQSARNAAKEPPELEAPQ